MDSSDIVMVGAGHGGSQCAIEVQQKGYAGTITAIGRESNIHTKDPRFRREYLAGHKEFGGFIFGPCHSGMKSRSLSGWHRGRRRLGKAVADALRR